MYKIIILMMFPILLSACNQGKLEQLEKENASLRSKIAELSETEQNRFNKAVDVLNTANDLQSYRKAEKTFGDFIEKFPTSTYLKSAQQHRQQAKSKADNIEKINQAKAAVGTLIAERKWKSATNMARSIKALISQEEYQSLIKNIENERYKPEKTTIDKLVSEIYELQHSHSDGAWRKYFEFYQNGRRVEVIGYSGGFGFLDVKRKSIKVYGKSGCANGESVEVFDNNTDKVNYFLNLNPDRTRCGGEVYRIIGKAKVYSDSSDIYIQAETLERI